MLFKEFEHYLISMCRQIRCILLSDNITACVHREEASVTIRFSLGRFTTDEDIETLQRNVRGLENTDNNYSAHLNSGERASLFIENVILPPAIKYILYIIEEDI